MGNNLDDFQGPYAKWKKPNLTLFDSIYTLFSKGQHDRDRSWLVVSRAEVERKGVHDLSHPKEFWNLTGEELVTQSP